MGPGCDSLGIATEPGEDRKVRIVPAAREAVLDVARRCANVPEMLGVGHIFCSSQDGPQHKSNTGVVTGRRIRCLQGRP